MKYLCGFCVSLIVVFLMNTCAFAAPVYVTTTVSTPVNRGMRVENYSKGGTFNMSKAPVVAPAIGYVNTSGEARLVGYYPNRRSQKMIPRHDGQYKSYDRKTVKRETTNKTRYRAADSTRKTQYKHAAYRNQTLEAYGTR